jgi:transcription elongation factor Elf1
MHDHSLGGPVSIGTQPGALHPGECFDGVYGCHLCWNAANDGKGTECECDRCGRETATRVSKAYDENASYAWCEECRAAVRAEAEREQERMDRFAETLDEGPDDAQADYDDEEPPLP